ncbi:phage protease [Stenotrophomonas sp. B1-1]|uniref:phage protease n=1 Tax=Stenotrophomonas sp. B1-1 TaxID=2710648 RepID=UPI0013D9B4A8|nr:phage protease [Stenotrophomonas sp. B1-1]
MHRIALNTDLSSVSGQTPPDWVELIPAGPSVIGRDGRRWLFDDAAARNVVDTFRARQVDLAIDWNHALQLAAPNGGPSPAAAWIHELQPRDGALWGRISWTPRGAEDWAGRAYRYLSPVFDYEPTSGRISALVSAALTNTPNLHLQALNSQESSTMTRSTALTAAITGALGLNAEASDDALAAAINQLQATALNSQQPSLDRFVPRADHDAVVARATNAEQKLTAFQKEQHDTAVSAEIDSALKAGKITPATVEYHRASCSDTNGLQRFRDFVSAAPVVAGDAGAPATPGSAAATALNASETYVAQALGIPADQFKKDSR